jgi:hypothetical protein
MRHRLFRTTQVLHLDYSTLKAMTGAGRGQREDGSSGGIREEEEQQTLCVLPLVGAEQDVVALNRELALFQHTSFGRFRFGTPDQDHWAVIYGHVETHQAEAARQARPPLWNISGCNPCFTSRAKAVHQRGPIRLRMPHQIR